MRVVHFTEGAGDPLWAGVTHGVTLVPLLENEGGAQVACVHLAKGAQWDAQSFAVPTALLVIHGRVHFSGFCQFELMAGVGVMLEPGELFALLAEEPAVLFLVEGQNLAPTEIAISTPMRLIGARWPGEKPLVP